MTEVLIIGGGVIGMSIARRLHQKGIGKVTILERGQIGREASYAAAGMLAPNAETDTENDFFHFCVESNKLYPQFAAELLAETGVDIELDRTGTLYLAFNDQDVREIRNRYARQQKADLKIERLTAEDIHKLEPFVSPDVREALFFPHDWQVENRKLLVALQRYAEINRLEIVENATVKDLLIENGRVVGAETTVKKFAAEKVVLTTGAWTSFIEADIKADDFPLPKIKPVRGQIISFQTAKRLFQMVIYSPRGYLVPRLDGRILIGATVEDVGFDNKVTPGGLSFLIKNALEISEKIADMTFFENWSGLRPKSVDGLPLLGAFPENSGLFWATGHYRNGILLAPLTGKIIAEKIVNNKDNEFFRIFNPKRFLSKAISNSSEI